MTATIYPIRSTADRTDVNYAARRAMVAVAAVLVVITVMFAAVAASTAVGALVDVGSRPAVASGAGAASAVRLHVAQPGDTLWSIAEQYRGDVSQARFVDALIGANNGTAIQVGQAVRLP